jgi:hypothetical protein
MKSKLTGSGIGARHAWDASTTSPARCWPGFTSRCGSGCYGLYFMGLNLSNRQIAQELGLDGSDVQAMTEQLRRGLVAKIAPVRLEGEVEIDEVYVVAGHKGQPAAVAKGGGSDAAAGWRRTSRQSSA